MATLGESESDASIRHLVELGYSDPAEVAAREAAVRREREAELQQAIALSQAGHIEESIGRIERLAVEDPQWAKPRQLLLEHYHSRGRNAEAREQLEWLQYHGVEHPRIALVAGSLALARRELYSAIDWLEYVCRVEPELPGVWTRLGLARLRLGRVPEAQEAFEHATRQKSDDALAWCGMSAVHLRQGRFELAAECALEALECDMQLMRGHYQLGVALARMDRPREAIAALEAAARVGPHSVAPLRWLARLAAEHLGESERADAYRREARARIQMRRASASRK